MAQKKFVTDQHVRLREMFRLIGPIVLIVGASCLVIGFFDFFTADPWEGPQLFWLNFVGIPVIFVGFVLTGLGYGGAVAKYQSREMAPVARDTFNYLAEETTEGIEAITRAVQKGKVVQATECPGCGALNKVDAKFCNECAHSIN